MADEIHLGVGQFKHEGPPKPQFVWCECCRMHFDTYHFINGEHGVGVDYGPYGLLLQDSENYDRLKEFIQWLEWRLHLVIGGQATEEELEIVKGHLNQALPFEAPE